MPSFQNALAVRSQFMARLPDTLSLHSDRFLLGFLAAFIALFPMIHADPVTYYRARVCCLELIWIGLSQAKAVPSKGATEITRARRILLLLVSIWIVHTTVATLVAQHPVGALIRQGEWFCHATFAWSVCLFFERQWQFAFQWIFQRAIPGGFLMTVATIVGKYLTLKNPEAYDWFHNPPFFSHIRHLGYYAIVSLLYSFASVDRTDAKLIRVVLHLNIAVSIAILFWSGGRGALVAASFGITFHFLHSQLNIRTNVLTLLVSSILGYVFAHLFAANHPGMGFFSAIQRTILSGSMSEFTTNRIQIWQRIGSVIQGQGVWGAGPDGYIYVLPRLYGMQPHNFILQCCIEWGVIGAFVFLMMIGTIGYIGWRELHTEVNPIVRRMKVGALSVLISLTFLGLIDGTFYHTLPLFFMALSIGILLSDPSPIIHHQLAIKPPSLFTLGLKWLAWCGYGFALSLFLLHLGICMLLERPSIPAPRDVPSRLLWYFPSSTHRISRWIESWQQTDPELARQFAHRLHDRCPFPSRFFALEADMLSAAGDQANARHHWQKAIFTAPGWEQERLIDRYFPKKTTGPEHSSTLSTPQVD